MPDFCLSESDRRMLQRHGLDSFSALWSVPQEAVDAANTRGRGWSEVLRLQLDDASYYLKRQVNFLSRSWSSPLGESMAARELRNIRRCQRLKIPVAEALFYGERRVDGERRALLLIRGLDHCLPLSSYLSEWTTLQANDRIGIIRSCAELVGRLHGSRLLHRCLYPKHIFLDYGSTGWGSRLIDMEKTRCSWLPRHGAIRDLETLLRRATPWADEERHTFLQSYLQASGFSGRPEDWHARLLRRQRSKERGR